MREPKAAVVGTGVSFAGDHSSAKFLANELQCFTELGVACERMKTVPTVRQKVG